MKETKMKNVCVDLDGVLANYDGWKGIKHIGDPVPGAREFVLELCAIPAKVVIFTTRTNPIVNKDSGLDARELRLLVEDWLEEHRFTFDSIACGEGKPIASAYVDDRAVVCRPLKDVDNQDFDTAVRLCKALLSGHQLGAQGSYSRGQIADDDEGDIKLMISTQENNVRIDFGKPVGWLGMPREEAMALAETIIKHARTL